MICTLSGSVRFEAEFKEAQRELSRRHILCFSLAVFPSDWPGKLAGWKDGEIEKTVADLLYFNRILHSDVVLVLGDGYIGTSTSREIIWAHIQDKKIFHRLHYDWNEIVDRFRSKEADDSHWLVAQAEATFLGESV